MDLLLALNVTIYGLGIVFLALLVLMVAIMLLTKLFSLATGKELSVVRPSAKTATAQPVPAPEVAQPVLQSDVAAPAEPVAAPLPGKVLSVGVKAGDRVRAGDELCVIEAMKMANSVKSPRDGTVVAVPVTPGESVAFGAALVMLAALGAAAAAPVASPPSASAPPTPAPATGPQPAALALTVGGARHAVDVQPEADGVAVVLDGRRYRVQRDPGNPARLLVDGQPHVVEVKEQTAGEARVVVDGLAQRVEVAPRAPEAPTLFTLNYAGKPHRVERRGDDGATSILLDGTRYQVQRDARRGTVLVDGKLHAVEVKERTGSTVSLWIDGLLQQVEIQAAHAAAAPAATVAAAPVPATPPPAPVPRGRGETITAPLPGKVIAIAVKPGDAVKAGAELCVIEAMKMGNSIRAQREGVVRELTVSTGQAVTFGAPLLILD